MFTDTPAPISRVAMPAASLARAVPEPVQVLLEERDPVARARAHTVLGRRALQRDELETARVHLHEAAELDPTDEVPRQLLADARLRPRTTRGWSFWRR